MIQFLKDLNGVKENGARGEGFAKKMISKKINTIAKEIYGADGVVFDPAASKMLDKLTDLGFGNLPVCMAKTQYSLSDDQTKLGRPEGFTITVRDVFVNAGAGFGRRRAVGRSSILRRNLLTLDVILSGPIQIRVT